METKITKRECDWEEVLDACRVTVGKDTISGEPSIEFKERLLVSEHSPIRLIMFKWKWILKSWVATHWSRHKWECFIQTQRSDRTGVDRANLTQDEEVMFFGCANIQQLIDTMRKRLCNCSAPETVVSAESLKSAITATDELLGNILVPNCIYRCGCPEMKPCGYWERLIEGVDVETLTNIQDRYDLYNGDFNG